jgi:hypothetical protein
MSGFAGVAQSVEQLIRNEKVGCSIHLSGTTLKSQLLSVGFFFLAKAQAARGCGRFCLRLPFCQGHDFGPGSTHFCSLLSKKVENRYAQAHAEPLYSCGFAPAPERVVRRINCLPVVGSGGGANFSVQVN